METTSKSSWLTLSAVILVSSAAAAAGGFIFGHREGKSASARAVSAAQAAEGDAQGRATSAEAALGEREAELSKSKAEQEQATRLHRESIAKLQIAMRSTSERGSGTPSRGEKGYIAMSGLDTVWGAVDGKTHSELTSFSVRGNAEAVMRLVQQGRVLMCPARTKVAVIDPGFFSTTVMILEGDHTGREIIIDNEFLHR